MKLFECLLKLANLSESIVMLRVGYMSTQVIDLIEKRIYERYPVEIQIRRDKQLEICRNEEDIFSAGDKEQMKWILIADRSRWQIRGLWKILKSKGLYAMKAYNKKNVKCFEEKLKKTIENYKNKGGIFGIVEEKYKKILNLTNCKKETRENLLFEEYESYYDAKYRHKIEGDREYNKTEWYSRVRKVVYPSKSNKKERTDPLILTLMEIKLKKEYWNCIFEINYEVRESRIKKWDIIARKLFKKPTKEIKKMHVPKINLIRKLKSKFSILDETIKNVKQVLFEKVKVTAEKILEKEKRARSKKIRRKFRRIVEDYLLK
jgi:hypothetical protein